MLPRRGKPFPVQPRLDFAPVLFHTTIKRCSLCCSGPYFYLPKRKPAGGAVRGVKFRYAEDRFNRRGTIKRDPVD